MKRNTLIAVVLVFMVFFVPLLAAAQQSEPVRIGFLYPLTGNMSAVGREALRGAQIAADQINDMGGIWNGRKIELVTGDASNTEAAKTEAERLITVEKVQVILGVYSSTLAFVAHAVADKYGVFFWESNAIAPRLRQMGHKYTFFFGPRAYDQSYLSVQAIKDIICPGIGIQPQDLKIAAIYQGTEWGKSATGVGFVSKAKEEGMQFVYNESYDPKLLDFTPIVQKIKMKNPDIVVFQSYIDDGFRLFRDARKVGLNPKVWYANGSVNVDIPDAFEKFGSDMNYIFAINQMSAGNIYNLSPSVQYQYRDFLKRYEEQFSVAMSNEAAIVYTAAHVLFEYVLPAAGSLDPDKLAAVAHDLSLPFTATARPGGVKYSAADAEYANQNLRAGAGVRQIFNGRYYLVWPTEVAVMKPMFPTPAWGKREVSDAEIEKLLLLPKERLVQ